MADEALQVERRSTAWQERVEGKENERVEAKVLSAFDGGRNVERMTLNLDVDDRPDTLVCAGDRRSRQYKGVSGRERERRRTSDRNRPNFLVLLPTRETR